MEILDQNELMSKIPNFKADLRNPDLKYYDFSFHELGVFDMPAQFKFVLK